MTTNPVTREEFGALVTDLRAELAETEGLRRREFFTVPRLAAPDRAALGPGRNDTSAPRARNCGGTWDRTSRAVRAATLMPVPVRPHPMHRQGCTPSSAGHMGRHARGTRRGCCRGPLPPSDSLPHPWATLSDNRSTVTDSAGGRADIESVDRVHHPEEPTEPSSPQSSSSSTCSSSSSGHQHSSGRSRWSWHSSAIPS